jgi:hypothetical protein
MDFRMFTPYIADQYLAESARRTRLHTHLFAGWTPRSRRRERVT